MLRTSIIILLPYLQFLERETTSSPDLGVVFEGRAVYSRSQWSCHRSGGNSTGLLDPSTSATLGSHGLVEPCPHTVLPVLLEMDIGNSAVSDFGHGDNLQ